MDSTNVIISSSVELTKKKSTFAFELIAFEESIIPKEYEREFNKILEHNIITTYINLVNSFHCAKKTHPTSPIEELEKTYKDKYFVQLSDFLGCSRQNLGVEDKTKY